METVVGGNQSFIRTELRISETMENEVNSRKACQIANLRRLRWRELVLGSSSSIRFGFFVVRFLPFSDGVFSLSISSCLCPTLYRLPHWLTRLSIRFFLLFAYRCRRRLCRSIHSDSIWSHRRFTRKNRFHFTDFTRRWNTKWFLLHFSYQHLDTDLLHTT